MSVVLALDLSTRTGWAIFKNGKLEDYGFFEHKVNDGYTSKEFPKNYLENAKAMAQDIGGIIRDYNPAHIVIEQVTLGKSIYYQKMLEWIHYAVINKANVPVEYMAVPTWRAILGVSLSSEQRKLNNKIKKEREQIKLDFEKSLAEEKKTPLSKRLKKAKNKKEEGQIKKKFNLDIKKEASLKARKQPVIIDGEKRSIVSAKNCSVDYVNEKYGFKFAKKDNDMADAICIGEAFCKKKLQ